MAVFSIAAVFSPVVDYDTDYTVLVFGLLTPFNLIYALWLFQNKAGKLNLKESFRYIRPAVLTGLFIFALSYISGWKLEPVSFFTLEILLWLGFEGIVLRKGKRWQTVTTRLRHKIRDISGWKKKQEEEKKTYSFSWFATLFIFAIAVVPPLEFSWFAYNHELRQTIKKEQLELADGIQKRERTVRAFLHSNQPDFSGNDLNYNNVQYHEGIYPVYPGKIISLPGSSRFTRNEASHSSRSEHFYLSIASTINLFYDDPAGLPPLYDSSRHDNLWHWDLNKDYYVFDYSRAKWKIPPALSDASPPDISFKIISHIPGGLRIDGRLQLVFAGMILALLLAIYWITKNIARQVCLTKIVGNAGPGLDDRFGKSGTGPWEKCLAENNMGLSAAELLAKLKGEYAAFDPKGKDLVTQESDIVRRSAEMQPLFECVWKTLDDKEKYLLYCLANDGLLNHKNEPVIYGLLHKNLLLIYDQRIRLISYSFRDFILSRRNTAQENALLAKMQSGASWTFMRTIVLVVVMSVFIFLFLTQQEVSAKIIALVTSLSALLPFLLKFGSSTAAADSKK
jgi:hypothetical protein